MKRTTQLKAFTLIELLMVIAIIGILAGILIPAVGAVRKQANIAASKSQLSQYVTALQSFKGEYNYYPFVTGGSDTDIDLATQSEDFIEVMAARDPSTGDKSPGPNSENRRQIGFHGFAESEFFVKPNGDRSQTQLADRFNNTNLILRVDGDGDGMVTAPDPNDSDSTKEVRAPIAGYAEEDSAIGAPDYYLYD